MSNEIDAKARERIAAWAKKRSTGAIGPAFTTEDVMREIFGVVTRAAVEDVLRSLGFHGRRIPGRDGLPTSATTGWERVGPEPHLARGAADLEKVPPLFEAGSNVLLCPRCSSNNLHLDGTVHYDAVGLGDGPLVFISLRGECGHRLGLKLKEHKGLLQASVEDFDL